MKRTALAILLCMAANSIWAEEDTLQPIVVERINGHRVITDCSPPNDAPPCSAFHALIRQNFTTREIGMLFGAATAYQEYPTGYSFARERYANLLRDIEEYGMPVPGAVNAVYRR